jgi:hypothetical protein
LFIGEIFWAPQLPLSLQLVGYPFQSFGRKSQKGFPLPSREKKKAIKSRFFKYYEVLQPSFQQKIELILN